MSLAGPDWALMISASEFEVTDAKPVLCLTYRKEASGLGAVKHPQGARRAYVIGFAADLI